MEPFVFDVGEGGLVSGLKNFPFQPDESKQTGRGKGRPLIVCLHGATYCAKYFDAHDHYSIRKASSLLNIPVLAINRPGYKQTPELPKCTNTGTDTHLQNEAQWLHNLVLPIFWRAYGPSLGCTSLVLMGHDTGGAVSLLTSSLHSNTTLKDQPYPLAGLIMTGLGSRRTMHLNDSALTPEGPLNPDTNTPPFWTFNLGPKTRLLLNSELNQSPLETIKSHEALNSPCPNSELEDFSSPHLFALYWRRHASTISCPIMYYLGDGNLLWDTSPEKILDFTSSFMSSPRVENGVLRGAGHCLELSWQGPSWFVKAAGFAMSVAVEREVLGEFEDGVSAGAAGRYSLPGRLSTVEERGSEKVGRDSGIGESAVEQAWPSKPA